MFELTYHEVKSQTLYSGNRIRAHRVKLLYVLPASIPAPVQIPTASGLTQIPANVFGKVSADAQVIQPLPLI